MNCADNFLAINDCVAQRETKATLHPELEAHLRDCEACREHWQHAEELSSRLRLLARATGECRPTASMESNLRRAFRAAQVETPQCATRSNRDSTETSAPLSLIANLYGNFNGRAANQYVAGLLLVAVCLAGAVVWRTHVGIENPITENIRAVNKDDIHASSLSQSSDYALTTSETSIPDFAKHQSDDFTVPETLLATQRNVDVVASANRKIKYEPRRTDTKYSWSRRRADRDARNLDARSEVNTEFLPLSDALLDADALDGGQVVRVQMPRAALASFGLPHNIERAAETVKADVLVGNDGIARAIRFVK